MTDRVVSLKRQIILNGLTAAFLSFCCGYQLAWAISSARSWWGPALIGVGALLFVASFLIGMRKLA